MSQGNTILVALMNSILKIHVMWKKIRIWIANELTNSNSLSMFHFWWEKSPKTKSFQIESGKILSLSHLFFTIHVSVCHAWSLWIQKLNKKYTRETFYLEFMDFLSSWKSIKSNIGLSRGKILLPTCQNTYVW